MVKLYQFTVYQKLLYILPYIFILSACNNQPTDAKTAFQNGDYQTSFAAFEKQAKLGDAESQNYLGIHYQLGFGVQQNIDHAKQWYERAAKTGYTDAQRNLGILYESGKLGERDFETAYIWLFAAYQQGNKKASITLKTLVNKLSPNNKRMLKKTAKQYIINDALDPEDDDF